MPTEIEIRDGRLEALQSRDAEIARLRAALKAQEDASVALNGRVGYDEYQALQDKADELRRQALAS